MKKDIKKESEILLAKIKEDTPKLLNHLIKCATYLYWDTSAYDYLVNSINRYVIIDKNHEICLSDQIMYDNTVYASFEVAQGYATTHEEVITLYEYIEMMYEAEKKERQSFSKWGYEFSINEDGSVSIRREMIGKTIMIQVEAANKITLV